MSAVLIGVEERTCPDCGGIYLRTGRNQKRCADCRVSGRGKRDYASRKASGKVVEYAETKRKRAHGGVIAADGECPICLRYGPRVVDHDHTCCPTRNKSCGRCVRGFLCRACNAAIGILGDDLPSLARAVAYLGGAV